MLAGKFRDQIVMVVIMAVGIAVGEQNDLPHRDGALQNFALGNFKRVLEVGATAGLEPVDAVFEFAAIVSERLQMGKHVGLRVERDNAGEVGIVELPEQ